jgi:nucleoid-associated protein YgaU
MIYEGSRYVRTQVITPVNSTGTAPRVLDKRAIPETPGVITYIVVEGERLDQLAARFYGDATKYWLILDANPDCLNPFELLRPGQQIRIPQNRVVTK